MVVMMTMTMNNNNILISRGRGCTGRWRWRGGRRARAPLRPTPPPVDLVRRPEPAVAPSRPRWRLCAVGRARCPVVALAGRERPASSSASPRGRHRGAASSGDARVRFLPARCCGVTGGRYARTWAFFFFLLETAVQRSAVTGRYRTGVVQMDV
jgi:hypothetical protein